MKTDSGARHLPNRVARWIALGIWVSIGPLNVEAAAAPGLTAVSPETIEELQKMHRRAEEFILQNDLRAAIRVYTEILLLEPDDETAYIGIGRSYMVLGDFGKAREAFQNALHINPDNEDALWGLRKIMDPDGDAADASGQINTA